jgi:hypothetical protein
MTQIWLTKLALTRVNMARNHYGSDKPTEQGVEKEINERLERWRAQFAERRKNTDEYK